jgi:hypothetical protein
MNPLTVQTVMPVGSAESDAAGAGSNTVFTPFAGSAQSSADSIGNMWYPRNPAPVPPPTPPSAPCPSPEGGFFGVIDKLMEQLQAMLGRMAGGSGAGPLGNPTPASMQTFEP